MKAASRFGTHPWRAVAAVLFSTLLASCSSTGEPTLQLAAIDPTVMDAGAPTLALGVAEQASDASGALPLPDEVASLPSGKPNLADELPSVAGKPQLADGESDGSPAPAETLASPMTEASLIDPKKKTFLSAFFGSTSVRTPTAPIAKSKPLISMASAEPVARPVQLASLGADSEDGFALPGVRQTALFEITRRSGLSDDSDVDLHEDEEESPVRLASAAGLARLAPNGLLKQRENVDVACLKPSLLRVLKAVEQHYGRKMIITSGYRSPVYNRKVRGAKKSMHMFCAAADVQVEGVSKWQLAQYVRSMPGRGGVGTYCHTESVHIDVGPERDWNWRCRRRK